MGLSLKKHPRLARVLKRIGRAELGNSANSLAFSSLLSLVPAAAVGFWYLERVGATEEWRERVEVFLLKHLNVLSSEKVTEIFEFMTHAADGHTWSTVSMILLAYSAVNLLWSFWGAIDRVIASSEEPGALATQTKPPLRRLGLKVVLRALAILGVPVALVLSLVAEQWARQDSVLNTFVAMPHVGPVYLELISATVTVFVFFLIYLLVPSVPVRPFDALKAAVITGVLLILGRWGLSTYNRFAFANQKLYGAFSAIPMTIVWVQLLWTIILGSAFVIHPRRSDGKRKTGTKR